MRTEYFSYAVRSSRLTAYDAPPAGCGLPFHIRPDTPGSQWTLNSVPEEKSHQSPGSALTFVAAPTPCTCRQPHLFVTSGAVRNSGRLRVATSDYSKPCTSRIFVDFMQIVVSTALARLPAFAAARQICCCSPLARLPSPLISIHSFLSRHESAYAVYGFRQGRRSEVVALVRLAPGSLPLKVETSPL